MKRKAIGIAVLSVFVSDLARSEVLPAPPPEVSPDPIIDVPLTGSDDPARIFYDYSWRSFIALNWPAMAGATNRGIADKSKPLGSLVEPRVWSTWKSRYEIFQPEGAVPAEWQSYDGKNPCGEGLSNEVTTLSSFSPFADFNQADFNFTLASPLVAQNGTYLRYEVRVNKEEFTSIRDNEWYIHAKLPTSASPAAFKDGSIEIKAAWRIATQDDPATASRYYSIDGAQVFDPVSGKCKAEKIALVGFHIVAKTAARPEWIWSSFEHVDNVPPLTTEPKAPPSIPLSLNNQVPTEQVTAPPRAPVNAANPPIDTSPMQVVREKEIRAEVMDANKTYWQLPGIKGTVWENYMLVTTEWPSNPTTADHTDLGAPQPKIGIRANTTMETFFQKTGCMGCHFDAASEGRDFVMFPTFDAFRPDGLDLSKNLNAAPAAGDKLTTQHLADDPVIKNLIRTMKLPSE